MFGAAVEEGKETESAGLVFSQEIEAADMAEEDVEEVAVNTDTATKPLAAIPLPVEKKSRFFKFPSVLTSHYPCLSYILTLFLVRQRGFSALSDVRCSSPLPLCHVIFVMAACQ
jgi:hypothetical protein